MSNELVTILLTTDALAEMQAAKSEAQGLATLENLPVDEAIYGQLLGFCQSKIAALEKVRLTISKPMHEAKKAVDALFAASAEPYETAKALLKGRLETLATARAKAERDAREAHAKALAAATKEANPLVALAPYVAPAPVIQAAIPNASIGYEWSWTLDDITRVPAEFLALNPATMKGYTARYRNSETIPDVEGITFNRVAKVTARQG